MHYKVTLIDTLEPIYVFLAIFFDDDQHIINALKNLAKSIFISSNAQLELTNFLCFVLFCCCVVSSARLNARFGGLEYISSFTYLWFDELLFRENILLTPRVNFISSHNYVKCPKHMVRCIFSKILLSIHVETYISIK